MTFETEAQARAFVALHLNPLQRGVVVIPTTHGHWAITSASAAKRPPTVCAICGEAFREYPNNPQPIAGGECCAYCDDHVVTPARIAEMRAAQ